MIWREQESGGGRTPGRRGGAAGPRRVGELGCLSQGHTRQLRFPGKAALCGHAGQRPPRGSASDRVPGHTPVCVPTPGAYLFVGAATWVSRGLCARPSLSSCLPCSCPTPTPSPRPSGAGGAGGQICPPFHPPSPTPQTQPRPAGGVAPLKPRDESLPSSLLLPVAMVMGGVKGGHRPHPLVGTGTVFPDTPLRDRHTPPLP